LFSQTEQNDVLGDFTSRLDKIGVEYMLTGSMALVHYAMPRTTVDIDIVVNILPGNVEKFIGEFQDDYYIPVEQAKKAVIERRMFNVLNNQTILKIDCVVLKETEYEQNAFSRRLRTNYSGDFEVWIISREDLILSKLNWAQRTKSERQLLDVASILRNGYQEDYVNQWARKLGVEELLKECFDLLNKHYDDGHDS
jgi:hypothetical protein